MADSSWSLGRGISLTWFAGGIATIWISMYVRSWYLEAPLGNEELVGKVMNFCQAASDQLHIHFPQLDELCSDFDGKISIADFPGGIRYYIPKALAFASVVVILSVIYLLTVHCDSLPQYLNSAIFALVNGDKIEETPSYKVSELIGYKLDYWLSTYPSSKGVALLALTTTLVLVGCFGVYSVSHISISEALWASIAGSGLDWTFTEGAGTGFALRLVGLLVAVGGMLITALLLGLVSEAINRKVDELKKGRSAVLESRHTLILGWNDKLYCLLEQLCMANESMGGAPIVILAEKDKEEMEEKLREADVDVRGSSIICRSGDPLMTQDLHKVSVDNARSIIILANHHFPEQSDAQVVRIVLSLMTLMKTQQRIKGRIVAELCYRDNVDLVTLLGGHYVNTVVATEMIGRLMLQCARQTGLGNVLQQLLGFAGNEFYLKNWPDLAGRTFGEVMVSFPDAVPLGVKSKDSLVELNPPDSYIMKATDELLVLAEDDDTYAPGTAFKVDAGECPDGFKPTRMAGKFLMIGWRRDMHDMIRVLDSFANPGSKIVLFSEVPISQRRGLLKEHDLDPDKLENCALIFEDSYTFGSPVVYKKLASLMPHEYSSILIFGDERATFANVEQADSRNLATMLQLRHIQRDCLKEQENPLAVRRSFTNNNPLEPRRSLSKAQENGNESWLEDMAMAVSRTTVVSEILDSKTLTLIGNMHISEYVMSNDFISMLLAMISECHDLMSVFLELFEDSAGNELYIHPASRYISPTETINFYQLIKRARLYGEIAIGYTRDKCTSTPILNPTHKDEYFLSIHTIATVIVVANDAGH